MRPPRLTSVCAVFFGLPRRKNAHGRHWIPKTATHTRSGPPIEMDALSSTKPGVVYQWCACSAI